MANIRVIPASVNQFNPLNTNLIKRRVCGYARVSTDRDEQFTSFQAQKDYYEKYIKSKPDWEFVGLYSDEGITGTNIKNRDGFKQMIDDALAGKIDLIVTKSVSRFARNTVDTLVFITYYFLNYKSLKISQLWVILNFNQLKVIVITLLDENINILKTVNSLFK